MQTQSTTQHRIWMNSAVNLEGVDDHSVDLVVTSPPYPMVQMWDDTFEESDALAAEALAQSNGAMAFERMHQCLDAVWSELPRVLKPGAVVCINVGDATRSINGNFQLFANHARIISHFMTAGFQQLPTIIWRKPTNAPTKFMGSGMLPPSAYVTLEHEYILIFRNGSKRAITNEPQKSTRRQSAFFWEERNIWFSDIWTDLRGTAQAMTTVDGRDRSAAYPLELPYRLINMFSLAGDTVLDPFLGTGTTTLAAMCAARNSFGFEKDPSMHSVILEKIAGARETADLLIRERLQAHAIFVHERGKTKGTLKYVNGHYGFPVMTQQEMDLRLPQLTALHYASNNRFNAIYNVEGNAGQALDHSGEPTHSRQSATGRHRSRQLKLF